MTTGIKTPFYTSLLFQVSVGIAVGIALAFLAPSLAKELKPLGTGFIKFIRMMIAPIIFGTVVVGIAKMGDMKKVGRVGLRALIYFEAVTVLALIIGLVMVHVLKPGVGVNADPARLDMSGLSQFTEGAKHLNTVDFILNIIPSTVVDAFAKGEILQVLLFSCIFGFGLASMGEKGKGVLGFIEEFNHCMFLGIGYIMRLAPVGAMGAMAFAVASFGSGTLESLFKLLIGVYGTAFLFVVLVLGSISKTGRIQPVEAVAIHQGRSVHRLGNVLFRDGAPTASGQAGERGMRQVGCGSGRAHGGIHSTWTAPRST